MPKKYTLEEVKKEYIDRGYTPLFEEYKNNRQLLAFLCDKGHTHKISFKNIKKGQRCGACYNKAYKYSTESVKKIFFARGLTPLFDKYLNSQQPLKFICSKGHKQSITLKMLNKGFGCTLCSGHRKYTFEFVIEQFIKEKYVPLFDMYINTSQKLDFICPQEHRNKITLSSWMNGHRCSECSGNKRVTIEDVKKAFKSVGYTTSFDDYKNNTQSLEYVCDRGHKNSMCFMSFRAGRRCSICAVEDRKYSLEEVKKKFYELKYIPLFDTYESYLHRLPFRCDNGHENTITFCSIIQGHRCSICQHLGVSKVEIEIGDFIEGLGVKVERNIRSVISPYELDIFVPSKNLAIEYCGLYWHSEISGGKEPSYHYNKRKLCQAKGIRLITIFEDEYLNNNKIVISRIQHALGLIECRIPARSCSVIPIDNKIAYEFLNSYHLQGGTTSKVSFGIYYKGALLGVITGGSLSRSHVAKERTMELKRLCFLPGYAVIGGASKLFRPFHRYCKENGFYAIRSYQDMRYGDPVNPVYEKLGFILIGESKYTPHYVSEYHTRRIRNQALRKTPEERLTGKTEWQIRHEQGFDRIWDCGHRTYQLKLS